MRQIYSSSATVIRSYRLKGHTMFSFILNQNMKTSKYLLKHVKFKNKFRTMSVSDKMKFYCYQNISMEGQCVWDSICIESKISSYLKNWFDNCGVILQLTKKYGLIIYLRNGNRRYYFWPLAFQNFQRYLEITGAKAKETNINLELI